MGRPKDMSPKARLLWLMGYNAPFDRHDWVVERPDGSEVRKGTYGSVSLCAALGGYRSPVYTRR